MSCRSAIFTVNNTPVDITLTEAAPTAVLPLGNVVRRFGQNLQLSGNGVNIYDPCNTISYYEFIGSAVFTTPTAGTYTVGIAVDGVVQSQQTVTTVADETVSLTPFMQTRLNQFSDTAIVTLVISTTATLPVTVNLTNTAVSGKRI